MATLPPSTVAFIAKLTEANHLSEAEKARFAIEARSIVRSEIWRAEMLASAAHHLCVALGYQRCYANHYDRDNAEKFRAAQSAAFLDYISHMEAWSKQPMSKTARAAFRAAVKRMGGSDCHHMHKTWDFVRAEMLARVGAA